MTDTRPTGNVSERFVYTPEDLMRNEPTIRKLLVKERAVGRRKAVETLEPWLRHRSLIKPCALIPEPLSNTVGDTCTCGLTETLEHLKGAG